MDMTKVLPAECVSTIISLTSPKDTCRLSVVSPFFKAIADSDAVWESFLPSDYKHIIDQSPTPTLNLLPKKQIYLHLADHHVLFANGNMTLSLEKATGKKCCMVSAKGIKIVWGDTPRYWIWTYELQSRFSEVAQLRSVWWLEIMGNLETKLLSPNTNYAIYFIFNFGDFKYNFTNEFVEVAVCGGSINESHKRVILDPPGEGVQQREDGWMEVEMGEFFTSGEYSLVDFKLWETNGFIKCGLIVEGVEFRPKSL